MSNQPRMEGSTTIERVRNTEDNDEESSNPEGATQRFHYYTKFKAKVTDKMGNQLRMGDSTIIDTLDFHLYAFDGTVPLKLHPTLESTSTPKKFLEDGMLLGSVNRIPVALNLSGTNHYLACGTPPSLTLETLAHAPDKVDDESGKRIIFWHSMKGNWSKFESVLHSGYFLCTRMGEKAGSLELWNIPQLIEAISEFQVSR